MADILIFGGTTEGRRLCEHCAELGISVRYCVATEDGEYPVRGLSGVHTHIGRLDAAQIAELAGRECPKLVIDATHPFARLVSANIKCALTRSDIALLRVTRERVKEQDCVYFEDMDALSAWLAQTQGDIFVTAGSSCARALSAYQKRVWMRVLPSMESLRICLEQGYLPKQIICMQGPFSHELNLTMFAQSGAKILVTKDSGAAGGFAEKLSAARSLGMTTAVLMGPSEPEAVLLETAFEQIRELCK